MARYSLIRIAILSPTAGDREHLRKLIVDTGLAEAVAEAELHLGDKSVGASRRIIDARPDIVLVDLGELTGLEEARTTLEALHLALPEAWLLVGSERPDADLILQAMRLGAREFLTRPYSKEKLGETLNRFLDEKRKVAEVRGTGKIYAVTAAKGGTGATTVAVNLATAAASVRETAKVALLDFNDVIGDTCVYLDLKPQFTVADALAASGRLDPVLLQSYMVSSQGVSVLAGAKSFSLEPRGQSDRLERLLSVAAQSYEFTFIDLPVYWPKDFLEVVSAYMEALLLVLTPDLASIWRTERLLSFLDSSSFETQAVKLIVNRAGYRGEIPVGDIEKALKKKVFWNLPNDFRASVDAIHRGNAVFSMNSSNLAHSYEQLAHRLIGVPHPKKRRSLFSVFP